MGIPASFLVLTTFPTGVRIAKFLSWRALRWHTLQLQHLPDQPSSQHASGFLVHGEPELLPFQLRENCGALERLWRAGLGVN